MNPDQNTARTGSAPQWWTLSLLAPAAVGLLPALLLAFSPGEKNEAYEWTQHRLAGLGFGVAFALVFLFGPWRRNWSTTLAGTLALGAMTVLGGRAGLADFHPLFVVAGVMVAAGYWFARREAAPAPLETALLGLGAVINFWVVSRLSWWQPLPVTLQSWPNRVLFLGVTAGLVWLLCVVTRGGQAAGPRWLARLIDTAVLLVLALAVLRTNSLLGYPAFPHHWGVYAAPADMVRAGGVLLGNVPSQYGFLNTLLLVVLPTDDRFTALFWLNGVLLWTSGTIIYFTLRAWLARWWWQLGAGLVTVSCIAFLCGYPPDLTGPLPFPSVGAMRFIWVHVLLGYLGWWHRRAGANPGSIRQALWIGSGVWLLGVLWSVESAVYVTAAWFPSATLLAMRPVVENLSLPARIRALFAGIGRALAIPGLLLAGTLFLLTGYYRLVLGTSPGWPAYWEYAASFSDGFGSLPIDPRGGVWVLLLLHTALLAALVGLETDRRRASLALVWAAWGALWAGSTYYIARSHDNNMTNLSPVLLLAVALLVQALKSDDRRGPAAPWVWLTVPPFVGAMLWLVLGNSAALKQQLAGYAVEPHTARLRPPAPDGLEELVARCQQVRAGPYSIFDQYVIQTETTADQADWLPLRSAVLLGPLSQERIEFYLNAHRREPAGGWLLVQADMDRQEFHWLFRYIDARFAVQMTLTQGKWSAYYYLPRPDGPSPEPLPLDASGLPANIIFGRDVRMMLPPASLGWPLRGDEREVILEFGYDPTAYLEGRSNGTLFQVELTTPAGVTFPLYDRLLDPGRNPGDRAVVRDRLDLPPFPPDSRLTLRTTPGPYNDNAWDWAYLAEASVVRQSQYSLRQFPGFSRAPDSVSNDVAYFSREGDKLVLALHAPASLTFRLHGGERSLAFDFGFREGAYSNGGNTDGAGYQVTLRRTGHPDVIVYERLLQPVGQPADQGNQRADFFLPGDIPAGAELVLSINPGPFSSIAWDWTYLANLRIK